jgi:CheY-like chemotaxis protein
LLNEINRFYQEEKIRINKSNINIFLNEPDNDKNIIVFCDKIRFKQILTNLIGNALKFTENGFIEIGYEIIDQHEISVYVKDSGIGIPPEIIQKVFERFHKHHDDKKLYGGTGLGLTISKKLVEQMGGQIAVESEIGHGSKFKFSMPYEISNNIVEDKDLIPIRSNGNYNWKDKLLLIVEDVESNFLYLEIVLKKTQVTVHWAKDGQEAIDICNKMTPDIILMDIQLPNKSGYEVTKEILQINPSIPIIAQTAYAFSDEKEKIFEAGCKEYLTKPINSELLLETIDKYIL